MVNERTSVAFDNIICLLTSWNKRLTIQLNKYNVTFPRPFKVGVERFANWNEVRVISSHRFVYVTRIYDTSDSVSQYLLGSFSAFQTEKAGVTPFLES